MNLVRRAAQQVGAGLSIADLDRMMDMAYGGGSTYTGKLVSQTTALAVSAVWACVNVLADDVATLPLLTYRQLDDGSSGLQAKRERALDHYLWGLLQKETNPELSAFRFKQLMQSWIGLWGNAYAEIEISGRGQVTALWPWRPDRVTVSRQGSATGPLQYTYRMQSGEKFTVPHERMLHLRGMGVDGVMGLSPIEVHRQTIGYSMAVQEHGARFFSNGARPLGILEHPGALGDKAKASLKQSWDEEHQGLSNAHRMAILEEGMKYHEVGMSMVNAQYIESANLSAEDIARIYKIPQHRIGLLQRSTNSNIEQQALEYTAYTLGPIAENWVQECEFALLSPRERQNVHLEFNFRHLLRGDMKSQAEFYGAMRDRGVVNADEIRDEVMGWNAQDGGLGQKYWMPVNYQIQGETPKQPEPSNLPPAPPSKQNGKNGKVSVEVLDRMASIILAPARYSQRQQ